MYNVNKMIEIVVELVDFLLRKYITYSDNYLGCIC